MRRGQRIGVHPIETDAEAAHIHLPLGEVLDAGRVVHVAQDLVAEGGLQATATLVEQGKLAGREVVEVIAVGAHEMAEHRTRDDSLLMMQAVDQFVDVVLRVEAQSVHAGIEFDMYRPAGDTLLAGCPDQCIQQTE